MHRPTKHFVMPLGFLACVIAALWMSGCNILGPMLYLAHGPEKIPQLYELDADRPTVIFFDDRAGILPNAGLRETVTHTASQILLDKKVVNRMIDARAATAVVANEPRGDLLPISAIGQKVGADIVIYVEPELFTLSPDNQTFVPTARLKIKIIDAANDTRLWPDKREGYTLDIVAHTKQGAPPTDAASRAMAQQEFARYVGQSLAQIFYAHEKTSASDSRTSR